MLFQAKIYLTFSENCPHLAELISMPQDGDVIKKKGCHGYY